MFIHLSQTLCRFDAQVVVTKAVERNRFTGKLLGAWRARGARGLPGRLIC